MAGSPHFASRADAGRRLADALPGVTDPMIAGLARGGVPVAAEVARALDAPLDVLVVRKIGHPAQPEYAMGAVSEDGVVVPEDIAPELAEPHLEEARVLARRLRGGGQPRDVAGRVAIVVDDGLATGRSMAAALRTAERRGAARVIMAVPVAAGPGFRELGGTWEAHAVGVVEPPAFYAVGQFYDDFRQVSDAEVIALLAGEPSSPPS